MRMSLVDSSVAWTWEDQWTSDIDCQKLPQTKCKEKKEWKEQDKISKNCGIISKGVTCVIGIPNGEEREKAAEEIFKVIMAKTFQKYWQRVIHRCRKLKKHWSECLPQRVHVAICRIERKF